MLWCKIYNAGGQPTPRRCVNPRSKPWFDVYDPATETWTQLPNMPRARDHFHAAVVDGKFYAIGGRQTSDINAMSPRSTSTTFPRDHGHLADPRHRTAHTPQRVHNGGAGQGDTGYRGRGWHHRRYRPQRRRGLQHRHQYVAQAGAHAHQAGTASRLRCTTGASTSPPAPSERAAGTTNVHEVFFLNGPTTCKPPGDTTAPVVQAPTQNLNANFQLNSTVPVRIQWSATDADGIASYELQQSTNGGPFTDVALPSATAKSVTPKLGVGNTYAFRVRAKDNAGNLSGWKAGPTFKVKVFQENSSAVAYTGAWSTQNITNASGGTLKYASAAGASASLTSISNALNVAWIAHKAADRGKAEVWVDGTLANTVDLYSSTLQAAQVGLRQERLEPVGGAHGGGAGARDEERLL